MRMKALAQPVELNKTTKVQDESLFGKHINGGNDSYNEGVIKVPVTVCGWNSGSHLVSFLKVKQ